MRKLLVLALLCPLAVFGQGPGPAGNNGNQNGNGNANGRGWGRGMGNGPMNPEQAEKRMKLARTLGLAEALDLDTADALAMGKTLDAYDARREAARKQMRDAREQLQKLARGDVKGTQADVEQAVQRFFDARGQLLATNREMVAAVSKNLSPEKKARAALFLGRFEQRIEQRVMHFHGGPGGHGPGGRGPGMGGPGMGGGMGMGGRMGMGPPGGDRQAFMSRGPGGPDDDACLDDDCGGPEDE
jgi:hypothetical protein